MRSGGLLTLWVGLVATAPWAFGEGESPRLYEVGVERLDVLDEPDDGAAVALRLRRGDAVEVRRELPGGWLAIAPPPGSFHWVAEDAVAVLRDGRIYVEAEKTALRLGVEGLPRPGPAGRTVVEGMVLRPDRRPRLTTVEGRRHRGWLAVAAGADEVRFVRRAGVFDPATEAAPGDRPGSGPEPAERRVSHAEAGPPRVPPDLVAPLDRIEGSHRSVVAGPIERWDFAEVRRDYRALLAARTDAPGRAVVRDRLDEVDREDELARSAREFEALVRASRRRDAVIERVRGDLGDLREAVDLAYDAEGLLQRTSRRVEGEKVFALLDRDGRLVAYARIPPGVDAKNLVGRQVGVRGKSRFDEGLEFRLLDVRDIDPLIAD